MSTLRDSSKLSSKMAELQMTYYVPHRIFLSCLGVKDYSEKDGTEGDMAVDYKGLFAAYHLMDQSQSGNRQ